MPLELWHAAARRHLITDTAHELMVEEERGWGLLARGRAAAGSCRHDARSCTYDYIPHDLIRDPRPLRPRRSAVRCSDMRTVVPAAARTL